MILPSECFREETSGRCGFPAKPFARLIEGNAREVSPLKRTQAGEAHQSGKYHKRVLFRDGIVGCHLTRVNHFMSDPSTVHAEQLAFWNGPAVKCWSTKQEQMDAARAPVADAAITLVAVQPKR
jgi:hypothetical protein